MVFSSILFLFYFLPATLLLYFIVPKRLKNTVLFLVSLVFYAWGEPVYIVIMLFSTVFDYVNGLLLQRFDNSEKKRKAVVIVAVVGNLLILSFFKYSDFLIQNLNQIAHLNLPLLNLALPIGISFYTFQTMSYTIDVYRRQAPVQKNIISFGAYVTMFPQLIAGPIVRYGTIAEQLVSRNENYDKFSEGLVRFCAGLGKKVLLANNIGFLWDSVKALPELSAMTAWLGIIAFAFQIYFDFSGYSDMAIGLGKMFGFEFMENFNYPYISKSITEFWRRWHISLGTWFREYVYIPLGGNRVNLSRMYLNLLIVWFLTGLWHGASWNFAIWGLYYGVVLILEKTFLLKLLEKLPKAVQHVYTLVLVLIGWVFFSFENMGEGMAYLKAMFGANGFMDTHFLYYLTSYLPVLVVLVIACLPKPRELIQKYCSGKAYIIIPILAVIVFIVSTAYLVDSTYNPFLYFRF